MSGTTIPRQAPEVVVLSGGVGGAKLVSGLARIVDSERLLVAANTGDDFVHLGLNVSPDLDSILYAVTGRNNKETGWGRADETWTFLGAVAELGGATWFRLGDGDLALHVLRTDRRRRGETLSAVTESFCRALGVGFRLVPMSDDPVQTVLETDRGSLPMQDYLVRERAEPKVRAVSYQGAADAHPNPHLLDALASDRLRAVVICPSNPFLSIGPILAVPGIRERLAGAGAPVVAVSPIVGGKAINGPLAKMLGELGHVPSCAVVARHYAGLIDGFVVDDSDRGQIASIDAAGIRGHAAPIVMRSAEDQTALAREILAFADDCPKRSRT